MFGIVGAAAHITHRFVVRDHSQHIDVGVKTSRIGCCHSGGAWVGGHIAVPVGEVVASDRRCSYGGGASAQSGSLNTGHGRGGLCGLCLVVSVGVGYLHRAALSLALSHGCAHHIVVDAEKSLGGGVARHGEGKRRIGGEFVLGTRHRIVAVSGGGERMVQLVLPTTDEMQRVGDSLYDYLGTVTDTICAVAVVNHIYVEGVVHAVARAIAVVFVWTVGDRSLIIADGHRAAGAVIIYVITHAYTM